jgi:hypothetical protein
MQKLTKFLPQHNIILAIAERVNRKYPNASGYCAVMAKDLTEELTKYKINATHVMGEFTLDEPNAEKYMECDEFSGDEYKVNHDWVSIEGKILDISARQFREDVHEEIPDVLFIDHTSPLYLRYDELGEA